MTLKITPEVSEELLLPDDILHKAACLERDAGEPLDAVVERLIAQDFERVVLRPTDTWES